MTEEDAIKILQDVRDRTRNSRIIEAICTLHPELTESEDEKIRNIIYLALVASEDELSAFYKAHNTTRKECTDWLEKQKEPFVSMNPALGFDSGSVSVYHESEDERIRKEILAFVIDMDCKESWIHYLEKQKYDRMKPVYNNQDSFESALEKAWKDYNDSGARTVDCCEDDYVECAYAKGFREGYLFGLEKQKGHKPNFDTHWENGSMVCEQKEQKPAEYTLQSSWCTTNEQKPMGWKPQAESLEALMYAVEGHWDMIQPTSYLSRRLEDLYEGLVNTYHVDESLITELHKVASEEDIEALMELKRKIDASMDKKPADRFEEAREKYQVEWSEEEYGRLFDIEHYLDGTLQLSPDRKIACIDFLKSLRPSWKPSEEQMRALEECGECKRCVKELYEHLKKL